MTIRTRKSRRLIFFLAPITVVLCGIFWSSFATKLDQNTHPSKSKTSLKKRVVQPLTAADKGMLDDLVADSNLVVLGRVKSIKTRDVEGSVYTYVEVEPTEIIKGYPKSKIIIRRLGGVYEGIGTYVAGDTEAPSWIEGSEVLVILEYVEKINYYITDANCKLDVVRAPDGQKVLKVDRDVRGLASADQTPLYLPTEETVEYMRSLPR